MNKNYTSYNDLKKPKWSPPGWLFAPVWIILYIIIFISFGIVFYNTFLGKIPLEIGYIFIANLFFNFAFTPIQFGLKNYFLAFIDIILVLFSLILGLVLIYKYIPLVSFFNIPYLIWVSFASFLQGTIVYLNWKK